jgi:glucose-1-phosphate thymidylyltransferase
MLMGERQSIGRRLDVVGLLPAGGQATRIAPLPGSKELYPIGFRTAADDLSLRPKVVCHYLLESMQMAGIRQAYVVLRSGKWDIPAYFGDGRMVGLHLAYVMMHEPFGVPYTLDQAYPFVQDAIVALGFPDIVFQPADAFVSLLDRQAVTGADVVLGLFPTDKPEKMDMVDFDTAGRARQIAIKSAQTALRYTWILAVWTRTFTRFMHDYLVPLRAAQLEHNIVIPRELFVGDIIQAALEQGMYVETVLFPEGSCLDIGTPEALVQAVRTFTQPAP